MFKKHIKSLFLVLLIFTWPIMLLPGSVDESLKDDVFAMVTSAKKVAHTIFVFDTSEQTNAFAYSDYINTCQDSLTKINHSLALCYNGYHQCKNVENNAACNVNLGCGDILNNCTKLEGTKTQLTTFCNEVKVLYAEPGKTDVVLSPMSGHNLAKRFVGPWDPRRADYNIDLCFYNWTSDTGGDVLNGTNSGHFSNNGAGATDRRDWDCMTNGTEATPTVSGLWLNWKYTTALDATKIIFANKHKFSFPPKARGKRKCIKDEYKPNATDSTGTKKVCYQEFETNPTDTTVFKNIKAQVRTKWHVDKTEVNASECSGTDNFHAEIDTTVDSTVSPPVSDPNSVDATSAGCDICKDKFGNIVDCNQYVSSSSSTDEETDLTGLSAKVTNYCCTTFKCSDQKCRDDDKTCKSDSLPCTLGYYSEWDQDQNHCCDILTCEENGSASDGDDASTCSGGSKYIPGPGSDATGIKKVDLSMTALASGEKYQNVKISAQITSLSFSPVSNVKAVVLHLLYGCVGDDPAIELYKRDYDSPISSPTDLDFDDDPYDSSTQLLQVPLTTCDDKGYSIKAYLTVYHEGSKIGDAEASIDLKFKVSYNVGSVKPIKVLNPKFIYYKENRLETDPSSPLVYEYECKTTFYNKQSYVQSGGPWNCDWHKLRNPDGHPYTRCVYPNHKVIDKTQWGTIKKTACTWLCRDEAVYDDNWKCRSFFSQMDQINRNGVHTCDNVCYDSAHHSLKECCKCISDHYGPYNYYSLEPCEPVQFDGSTGPTYKCCTSGFQEGTDSDGNSQFVSGFMTEITTGHIHEVGDAAFQLNDSGYVSPYNQSSNQWYRNASLITKSNNFLTNSFVSVFKTGDADSRDTVCIYDLLNTFSGQDCGSCGTGCCSIDIGGGNNPCDYPSFWMKTPNTEGGKLVFPAQVLTGTKKIDFQNLIANFQSKGGPALSETLYDTWRYIGGMKSAYDPAHLTVPYDSPIKADPECFTNDAIVISAGQPVFDSNKHISDASFTTQTPPTNPPFRTETVAVPTAAKPYIKENWYLSALDKVASFIHTHDAYHSKAICREDNNVNAFGFDGSTASDGTVCSSGTDSTGKNVMNRVDTVAIGDWVLAPLYTSNNTGYLENSLMKDAAHLTGGTYYGLTTKASTTTGATRTFQDLTDLFNNFAISGTPQDRSSGRPQFTSAFVQPFGPYQTIRGDEVYIPVTIPIDNGTSRFWFGNLKKYYLNDSSHGCTSIDTITDTGFKEISGITPEDCFAPSDSGSDISARFRKTNAGGVAKKLDDALNSVSPSCNSVSGSPCYLNNPARNLLYDDGNSIKSLSSLDPSSSAFSFITSAIGKNKDICVDIIDYLFGYDKFDDDGDGIINDVRDWDKGTLSVDDPFAIDFSGASKVNIRPTLMGAVVHSQPIAVYYGSSDTTRIFVGANDGFMHEFDQDGNEKFAYLPSPVLHKLSTIADNKVSGFFFNSFVDGPITLFHLDTNLNGIIDGNEKAYLIFGYRRGAKYYTVLDISSIDSPKLVQNIQVEGESWSKPVIFKKSDGNYYMTFGGGYDTCFDSDSPMCPLNGSGHLDPEGNVIYVYKFDGSKFNKIKEITLTSTDSNIHGQNWLVTSIVAAPMAINTSDYLYNDTEFIYYIDVTSTIFRLDVRNFDTTKWIFKAVYRTRANAETIPWAGGLRTYNSFAKYPPLMQYLKSGSNIPIPFVTGNAINPKEKNTNNEMIVYYDQYNQSPTAAPVLPNLYNANTNASNSDAVVSGKNGWVISFASGEKGITAPLVYYDRHKYNSYSLFWTTYEPAPFGQCRNFGNSRLYSRNLINGTAIKLDSRYDDLVSGDSFDLGKGFAKAPQIAASTKGGEQLIVPNDDKLFTAHGEAEISNASDILKWYEFY